MEDQIDVNDHPSGWKFTHYQHENGHSWFATGKPPGAEHSTNMLRYEKTPEGKLDFSDTSNDFEHERDPKGAAFLKQHTLELHNATEHVVPKPPPKQQKRIYYHGTTVKGVTHILPAKHIGREGLYPETDPNYAYATTNLEDAWFHAGNAASEGQRPRVYQVRPIGGHKNVERDPDYHDDGSYRAGVMSGDHRSPHGFEVVREMKAPRDVRKWSPEVNWDED